MSERDINAEKEELKLNLKIKIKDILRAIFLILFLLFFANLAGRMIYFSWVDKSQFLNSCYSNWVYLLGYFMLMFLFIRLANQKD